MAVCNKMPIFVRLQRMKPIFAILFSCVGLLAGCKQDDTVLTTQQTSTVRYLESGHTPRLMSEDAAKESIDENPEYYTVYGHGEAYRYIATMYDEGRDARTEIEAGDTADIYFDAYVFNYASLANAAPYWSNREETIAALEQTGGGLNIEYWSVDPLALRAGGRALKGISRALIGCREGDRVEVYMTYKAAYGSGIVGVVPKESPVAWFFTVEKVTKH